MVSQGPARPCGAGLASSGLALGCSAVAWFGVLPSSTRGCLALEAVLKPGSRYSGARCEVMSGPGTSLLLRPLRRSTIPLVWDVWGRVCRSCAPGSAQALAKAGVKQEVGCALQGADDGALLLTRLPG